MSGDSFVRLTSRTIVLPDANIDTDQIIPARFLTTTTREGLGRHAFNDWRYDANGEEKPDCVLNTVDASTHRVIVAGENFGCGSSREHAPWAIYDFGVRVVVSSRIADIFRSNAQKNGVLPVVVGAATHAQLLEQPGREITVDLEACELRYGNHVARFEVDPFARACLMEGVDSLGYLLKRTALVEAFETRTAA